MILQPMHGAPYVPGQALGPIRFGLPVHSGAIMVLRAAELAGVDGKTAGLIVVDGAPLSHAMLRLLSLGYPTVIVEASQAATLCEGSSVLLDGGSGLVRGAEPGEQPKVACLPERKADLATADGAAIALRASVPGVEGATLARQQGASAIGLLRSEYLVPGNGELPDQTFFRTQLETVCRAAAPLPVTVRLVDFGASKCPSWLRSIPGAQPFGLQGVRWFDHEPVTSIVRAQVRAVAQLVTEWDLRLLLPFVTRPEECIRWRNWIEELSPVPIAIGAMAETPAALLAIPELLDAADFVAIGCNDLLQGLFVADRDLPAVQPFLDPYAPAVFRILRIAAESAGDQLDRIQLCGLLPQLPGVLPALIGLGFRAFSVEPVLLPWLAADAARVESEAAAGLAGAVCSAPDGHTVRRLLDLRSSVVWAPGALARSIHS